MRSAVLPRRAVRTTAPRRASYHHEHHAIRDAACHVRRGGSGLGMHGRWPRGEAGDCGKLASTSCWEQFPPCPWCDFRAPARCRRSSRRRTQATAGPGRSRWCGRDLARRQRDWRRRVPHQCFAEDLHDGRHEPALQLRARGVPRAAACNRLRRGSRDRRHLLPREVKAAVEYVPFHLRCRTS